MRAPSVAIPRPAPVVGRSRRPGARDGEPALPASRAAAQFDVTGLVNVSDPEAVGAEVGRIFRKRYGNDAWKPVAQAFRDVDALFRGEYPGYRACETSYHNIQHTLDMTLATARLLDGYDGAAGGKQRLGPERFAMGVISGLFHDAGYIRSRHDTRNAHGAVYAPRHVSRSARFLAGYMPRVGLSGYAGVASRIVHFTGYEKPLSSLRIHNEKDRLIGCVLATADLLAQMSDRQYLEKCRDLLYPEFERSGLTRVLKDDGSVQVVYASGADLLSKTPAFFRFVLERLDSHLDGVYRYSELHFGRPCPYMREVRANLERIDSLVALGDPAVLARSPLPGRNEVATAR